MRVDLLEEIERLKGKTLSTLRGKEFNVIDVAPRKVTVVPLSTGKARVIPFTDIEAAARIGGEAANLTAKRCVTPQGKRLLLPLSLVFAMVSRKVPPLVPAVL